MKNWKPFFIKNSRLPVWLSKIAPIDVYALSFGPFVWCRGVPNERVKTHETIHFQQQLELLFVFQWILYSLFFLFAFMKFRNARKAYFGNPFEREAYVHDNFSTYLKIRPRFNWVRYR